MQRGPAGSALWQATPGPKGGLGLRPACRDALLVGRLGSSVPPPPPQPLLPPSSSSSSSTVPPREAAAVLRGSSDTSPEDAHETLHSTNGYKCVFKEIPGLPFNHRHTAGCAYTYVDTHTHRHTGRQLGTVSVVELGCLKFCIDADDSLIFL